MYIPDHGEAKIKVSMSVLALLRTPSGDGKLVDAIEEIDGSRAIIDAILRGQSFRNQGREIVGWSQLQELEPVPIGEPRVISNRRDNAALQFGDRYFLKVFRRMEEGVSPDLEVGRFLAARAPGLTPRVLGAFELRAGRMESSTVAVLQQYVSNEGTAWAHTRRELGRFYERVLTRPRSEGVPIVPDDSLVTLSDQEPPQHVSESIGVYHQHALLLGQRTAEMHLALASAPEDPGFSPAAYSSLDRRSAYQSLRNLIGRVLRTLRAKLPQIPPASLMLARAVLERERDILGRFEPMLQQRADSLRIRVHGDFHLEQALWTGKDFVLIDFDGGHDAPVSDRRRKRSALRDVAGMIRSFHYAAYTGLLEGVVREDDRDLAEPWANVWCAWISAAYLRGYRSKAGDAPFLPQNAEQLPELVDRYVLSAAFTELGAELVQPGPHLEIPLRAIASLIGVSPGSTTL
jgi:maltose alpha-D-glucosyltransferase/alpha-amylase